jgi:hypothetical protein
MMIFATLLAVTMAYVDEDGSSGTGEDLNMLDRHKRHPVNVVPSASGGRKRSRKATWCCVSRWSPPNCMRY